MPAPGDGTPRCLLGCILRRHARLSRRWRRLDLMLWTRPIGTPVYVAAEALYARTLDELGRCRCVLEVRYGLRTADVLK
jgi:hypothetical protein